MKWKLALGATILVAGAIAAVTQMLPASAQANCGIADSDLAFFKQVGQFLDSYDQQITKMAVARIVGPDVTGPWGNLRFDWYNGIGQLNTAIKSCTDNVPFYYDSQLSRAGLIIKLLDRAIKQSTDADTTPGITMLDPVWTRRKTTRDPESDKQYYLKTIVSEDWLTAQPGSPVIVAVIDDGIYVNHDDLRPNIWVNPRELVGNSRDDDDNGYVDDIYGYNFIKKTGEMTVLGDHGTHVAGIIGAVTDNGIGVAGIANNVKLMPLIACSTEGCPTAAVAEAVKYAVDNGARVINVSLSTQGTTAFTPDFDPIIQYAYDHNVLVVAAAGNGDIEGQNGQDLNVIPQSPICNLKDLQLGVGATDAFLNHMPWSNYGNCVDIYAPGSHILSTAVPAIDGGVEYSSKDGTSFAAPIVTGVAARLVQKYPTITPAEIINLITMTAHSGVVSLDAVLNIPYVPKNQDAPVATSPSIPPASVVPTLPPSTEPAGTYDRLAEMLKSQTIDQDKKLVQDAPSTICPARIIKGSGSALYYCGIDGKRYVFPNAKIYDTWFHDFNGVVTVPDADLSKLQLGGNVTARPGTLLVKIKTDPRVYAVASGGMLRWVPTEELAIRIFGPDWSKEVIDVPDEYFTNYVIGPDVSSADSSTSAPLSVQSLYDSWVRASITWLAGKYKNKDL